MGWINTPADSSSYTTGSTVPIDIQPTGNTSLGGISITGRILIQLGDVTKYSKTVSVSGTVGHIEDSFVPDTAGTYKMNVSLSYTLSGISVDSSFYSSTFTVTDNASDGSSGDGSSFDPQPDGRCHYKVIENEDNSNYYCSLDDGAEYTIDLNGSETVQIPYTLTSYDSSSFNLSTWIQTGSEAFIKQTQIVTTETAEVTNRKMSFTKLSADTDTTPTVEKRYKKGYVEYKGLAAGTAVVEMYIQVTDDPEFGSLWYDRQFAIIHVIDSTPEESSGGSKSSDSGNSDTPAPGSSGQSGSGSSEASSGSSGSSGSDSSNTSAPGSDHSGTPAPGSSGQSGSAKCTTHTYGAWTTTKKATYKAAGARHRTCTVCGDVQTEVIPKLTIKTGTVLKNKSASYKVLKGLKTVAYKAPLKKSVKTVSIPATVKLEGKTYKVTAIAAKAFSGCSKLTKVTIGKNVSSIGASAFAKCKKLKNIKIQGSGLKKVGANAFKGIDSKAVVKVPKKKLKAYTSLLKKKGLGKKAKVTA